LKADQIIKILEQNGFRFISQRGSHQKWRNDEIKRQVIVPYHKGKDLPDGTMKSITEGSGIPKEYFYKS